MPLKSPGHSTYFGVIDKFHLFRINAPIFLFFFSSFSLPKRSVSTILLVFHSLYSLS